MGKKRFFLYISVIFALGACKREGFLLEKSSFFFCDTSEISQEYTRQNPYMDSALYESVHSYINEYYSDPGTYYYPVYFFRKDTTDYFTIWEDQYPSYRVMEENDPRVTYDYHWFLFNEKFDVILVSRHDDKRLLPFDSCMNQLGILSISDLPRKELWSVLSSRLYRTCKYNIQAGKYRIERLHDTILWDSENENLEYEIFMLKKENKIKKERERKKVIIPGCESYLIQR